MNKKKKIKRIENKRIRIHIFIIIVYMYICFQMKLRRLKELNSQKAYWKKKARCEMRKVTYYYKIYLASSVD
jgi:hypothetical protein